MLVLVHLVVSTRRYQTSYLEFLGPGGFATPDDNEALVCQGGFLNTKEVGWNDISKGMNREILQATDEEQMRSFWREWDKRRTAAESKNEEAGKVKV